MEKLRTEIEMILSDKSEMEKEVPLTAQGLYAQEGRDDEQGKESEKITFRVHSSERNFLEREAVKRGMSLSKLTRTSTLSYLRGTYYLPLQDEEKRYELNRQILAIGSNINQLVRHVHTNQYLKKEDVLFLSQKVFEIEKRINEAFETPLHLETEVQKAIKENEGFRQTLFELLKPYEQENRKTPKEKPNRKKTQSKIEAKSKSREAKKEKGDIP